MKTLFLSLCCAASFLCSAQNNVKIINAPAAEITAIHQKLQDVAGLEDLHLVTSDTSCAEPAHVHRCVHTYDYKGNGSGLSFLYQLRGTTTPFIGLLEVTGSFDRVIRLYKFLVDANVNEAELKELHTTQKPPRLGTLRISIQQTQPQSDSWTLRIS